MTTPERSAAADRLILRAILAAARPDQLRRLMDDVLAAGPGGARPGTQ